MTKKGEKRNHGKGDVILSVLQKNGELAECVIVALTGFRAENVRSIVNDIDGIYETNEFFVTSRGLEKKLIYGVLMGNNNEKRYTYRGKSYTVSELAELAECSVKTMEKRLKIMIPEQAVSFVVPKRQSEENEELFEYQGSLFSVGQLARVAGCSVAEMNYRLDTYKSIEECLEVPLQRSAI